MRLRHAKTLITGKPGVGKTTLIRKIINQLQPVPMAGFYTREIRSKGHRSGFELQGLNGDRRILAHVDLQSLHRVGKYGVDTAGFDKFLLKLDLLNPETVIIVIDEIGKMELFSNRFHTLIRNILSTNKMLLATIALHGKGLIEQIKQRPDVHLLEVTGNNRENLETAILE
ncbi:MAG: NTPase [Desulfobacteraceae bacterium]|nr:NTPase [Desulfobacteraceae bacterium]